MNEFIACFSLGSNMGDRRKRLEHAADLLCERAGFKVSISGMYESPAWGFESDSSFINCCLALRTGLNPFELIEIALGIEEEMGRTRGGSGYSDRVIDLDLLLCGDQVISQEGLIVPHPRMNLRKFVLVPLAEILPTMRHPVSGLTITELLENCPDQSEVKPIGSQI